VVASSTTVVESGDSAIESRLMLGSYGLKRRQQLRDIRLE